MIKKIFTFFLILTVSHCGFTPIYNNANKINYTIFIIEKKGDSLINNLISSEINKISNYKADKKVNLKIKSNYKKLILSKNSKGAVSDYQLIISTTFIIEHTNNSEEISFQKKQNMKNISDFFEQKNYENTIKKNFAISIVRKLNLELLNKK